MSEEEIHELTELPKAIAAIIAECAVVGILNPSCEDLLKIPTELHSMTDLCVLTRTLYKLRNHDFVSRHAKSIAESITWSELGNELSKALEAGPEQFERALLKSTAKAIAIALERWPGK